MNRLICALALSAAFSAAAQSLEMLPDLSLDLDDLPSFDSRLWLEQLMDTAGRAANPFHDLTDNDYREVAMELGVETAAIKAVVDIEAGLEHQGFWRDGMPLINFDLSMYRQFAPRHGVKLEAARKAHPLIFQSPNRKKYGSYQAAQHARLEAAIDIDRPSALKSTFWGMFQIGGFNYRKCGMESVEEFVDKMSRSERDQLELFATFIRNSNMVDDIRHHRWLSFALKYNGPKARSRGYHTRLATAYARHKKLEESH